MIDLKQIWFILIFLLVTISLSEANIIYVDDDKPADYNTIQAAILASKEGDVVIVHEGIYNERINIDKKIRLTSTDPNNQQIVSGTIIDGIGDTITIDNVKDTNCVLSGFTITNGMGRGIYCSNSSITVSNCIITRNSEGAMYNNHSKIILTNCIISKNTGHIGGAIYNNDSNLISIGCMFMENSAWQAGAITAGEGSNVIIENCIFARNSSESHAGAISTGGKGSSWTITNSTFFANFARDSGGGIYHGTDGKVIIKNCIFWDNKASRALIPALIQQIDRHYRWDITYCCIQGLDELDPIGGEGNISNDPLFADPNSDDFHLKSQSGRWDQKKHTWIKDLITSPCIDAGDPNDIGWKNEPEPNGKRINMGAYGGTSQASKSIQK